MSLKEKLIKLRDNNVDNNTDWEKTKKTWLNDLDTIYSSIKSWFSDLEKEKLLTYSEETKTIQEEHIGTYDVNILKIHTEINSIIFEPIGTLLIGAWGRIDFYSNNNPQDKMMLLKTKSQNTDDFVWEIRSKKDRFKGIEFTQKNLENVIEKWLDR
ncbi:MAG: hypothetical protein AABZ74_10130 [Cyanobacteriota bacterium]